MRKTSRPVSLKLATWTMTDTVSSTNSPPMMASTSSCLVMTLMQPSAPPQESEPVSPMNTIAGGALNHRKPRLAPTSAPQQAAMKSADELVLDAELEQARRLAEWAVR